MKGDSVRQPIVSVLGHVDHGKTSFLDYIRGSTVVSREAGAITQHIGATEVPVDAIYKICGPLLKGGKLSIPGLLFIDTPGHHSFTTLRSRGGNLADMAILVIDINEGLKPQTIESINILKRAKTPFIIALNKIDLIYSWRVHRNESFLSTMNKQNEQVQQHLEEKLYNIVGKLYDIGFSADRYDKISNFQKNIALVPISAKTGEGIADIMMILVGLAQKFLEEKLWTDETGPGEGTVLEIKEEKGLGPTMDFILYKGSIRRGDTIVLEAKNQPRITKVKAILKPKPLDEIRDPREKFDSVEFATAAAGVKIVAQNIEDVIAGGVLRVANSENLQDVIEQVCTESKICVDTCEGGIVVKADAIGSLEGLAFEAKAKNILLSKAEVGDISRRDVVEASACTDPTKRVILGFNVKILPDAKEALIEHDIKIIQSDIVYRIIDDYEEWLAAKKKEMEAGSRKEMVYPGKAVILPDCIFRVSKPAIVGVRVLAGRLRVGQRLIRDDGKEIGKIKSIRDKKESLKEAIMGQEVAISIDGATAGRQIDVDTVLYVDIPGAHCKELNELGTLSYDDKDVLDQVCKIKRKEDKFWGM
ncbi:MAG: translation initiation factor IF-2 [Thermoplasmata archaeon]|nr:translation initiation factor IF-2 [Thermoplasmata archaeon]